MLQGKTAIVTGGTRGIGLAIVRTFLKNGANVALFGSRSETVGKALKELKEENPNWPVIGMAPDIAKYDEMKAAVDEVVAKFGALDIMVNNAGISAREPLCDYTPESFQHIMDLNVTAVFNGCKAAETVMKGRGGSIINTSSMVSLYGQPSGVGYPTSKFCRKRHDKEPCARAWARRHTCERDRPGRYPHGHGGRASAGACAAHIRAHTARPRGRTGGGCKRVPVPCKRPCQLRHRRNNKR